MRASARVFDAVMFLSRNGTQGEAGVGLKPLSVPSSGCSCSRKRIVRRG